MIDRGVWLEARRKGIGGSDAAAILGLSRYRTAIDVWEDKLGLRPERPQTPAMAWGLRLEDAIATAYVESTGRRVRKVGGIRRAHHVTDFPMIASIDRLSVDGERVVELKKKRTSDDLDDLAPPENRVPADWYVQTQHYLEVVDREIADVAILVGGTEFRIIEIPRDRDFGADLRTEEGAFWRDYVLAEKQPPVTAEDLEFLARKYPRSSDDEIVATSEVAALVDEILDLDDRINELERTRKGLRAKVEEAMGEAGRLLTPRASVRWRSHDVTRSKWKELAAVYRESLATILRRDLLDPDDAVGVRILLETVEGQYSETKAERPFFVDRKKEGAR